MRKIILSAIFVAGVITAQGQAVTETVNIKNGSGDDVDTWYSLADGTVGAADAMNWDLSFQIGGMADAGVGINSRKGVELFLYNGDWTTVDTTGMTWTNLYNSFSDWSVGALNSVKGVNPFDYGWGAYVPASHQVEGDKVFILRLADATYKKLAIDSLAGPGSAVYYFKIADLDGSNEVLAQVDKNLYANKNYVYYSIIENKVYDNEPVTVNQWDLLFTEYTDSAQNPMNPTEWLMHVSSGVLSNPNVKVFQVDNVADSSTYMNDWWHQEDYISDINAIGFDWKSFNMTSFTYEFAAGRVYFVQAVNGDIWKLVFTGYDSSVGSMIFTKEKVSTAGLQYTNVNEANIMIYPNPASSHVSIILNNMQKSEAKVHIMNLSGQIVYQHTLSGTSDFEVKNIPVSSLTSGVYLVKVISENQNITKKLIVK